jgi:hypothetical protein
MTLPRRSNARSANARGTNARSANARGANARSTNARGANARSTNAARRARATASANRVWLNMLTRPVMSANERARAQRGTLRRVQSPRTRNISTMTRTGSSNSRTMSRTGSSNSRTMSRSGSSNSPPPRQLAYSKSKKKYSWA